MQSTGHFQLMAQYNQWMNHKVYAAAAKLTEEQLNAQCGAYFGSIIGTLNHILVADIIWLKRYSHHPTEFTALKYVNDLANEMDSLTRSPIGLDTILYADVAGLKQARENLDNAITAFTEELTETALTAPLAYHNTKGEPHTKQFGHLLMHFFNHQTHHRGQVTTLLSQYGVDVGVTDLLALLPDVQQS